MKPLCKCGRPVEPNPDGRHKCRECRRRYHEERREKQRQVEGERRLSRLKTDPDAALMLDRFTKSWGLTTKGEPC